MHAIIGSLCSPNPGNARIRACTSRVTALAKYSFAATTSTKALHAVGDARAGQADDTGTRRPPLPDDTYRVTD